MEIIQEMKDRKLFNTRQKAVECILLGADNWDAVDVLDKELLKRGLIKETTREQFNQDNMPKHTVLV